VKVWGARSKVPKTISSRQQRPAGSKKLAGPEAFWCIRVGEYRIIYSIEDAQLVVLVIKLGHRREVYR
jgi:mRNA interferase RelE/StbE